MTNNARWTRGNYPFENYPLELKSETSKWFIGHWWNIKGVISSKSRIFQACENWEFPTQECHSKGQAGAWEIPIFVIWQVWAFCDSHLPTIHTHSQLCKPNEKDKLSLFAKDFTVSIFLGIAKNPMLPYCKQESLLSITSAPWMRNAPSGPAVWWKMNFEQIAKIFLLAYFFGVGESALIFAWCFWWHFQPGPKLIQWGLKPNLTILADVHLLMFPQSATLSWGVIKCVCVHVCSWCHCLCWRWSRAMVLLMLSVRTSELSLSKKWLATRLKWQRHPVNGLNLQRQTPSTLLKQWMMQVKGWVLTLRGWNSNAHVYTFCQPLAQRPLYNVTK